VIAFDRWKLTFPDRGTLTFLGRRKQTTEETAMSCPRVVAFTMSIVFFTAPLVSAETIERVDDRTIISLETGRFYEAPLPPASESPTGMSKAGRVPGLSDGLVGCSTSDDCFPFDLDSYTTGPAIDLLPEGNYPYDATMNSDGTEVWFVGASGDGAVVVDRATNTITHRIPVGEYPTSIAFSDDGSLALASARDGESVTIIDTETYTVTNTLQLPAGYDGGNIALDPVSKLFYLIDWYDNTLFEIASDGSEILRQVDLGVSLWQLVASPEGGVIYVTDRAADVVRVIDRATLTEVQTISVGEDPWGIDLTQDGSTLVVACEDSHEVYIIDTVTLEPVILSLNPEADPRDVDILDESQRAFVCGGRIGTTSDPVYVIDLAGNTIETSIEANGTNTNVIAVQAQMHSSGSAGIAQSAPWELSSWVRAVPNPCDGEATILYHLSRGGPASLALYDITGRKIRSFASGKLESGDHEFNWDGSDDDSRSLQNGLYFLHLNVTGMEYNTKVILRR
jgi:YVTN family beta-propeller protein